MHTQALLRILVEDGKADLQSMIEHFYSLGIINDGDVTKALIRREYMARQGLEESGRSIMMDLAVKHDCSFSYVKNCVYRCAEFKV